MKGNIFYFCIFIVLQCCCFLVFSRALSEKAGTLEQYPKNRDFPQELQALKNVPSSQNFMEQYTTIYTTTAYDINTTQLKPYIVINYKILCYNTQAIQRNTLTILQRNTNHVTKQYKNYSNYT
jgi:hypothetical protein